MSYFSEWLAEGDKLVGDIERVFNTPRFLASLTGDQYLGVRQETIVLKTTLQQMRSSRIVKMPTEQATVFLGMEHILEQDFSQLHSPYQHLYIEFPQPVKLAEYDDVTDKVTHKDVDIKAVMITELTENALATMLKDYPDLSQISFGLPEEATAKIIQVNVFIPLARHPRNTYVATFAVSHTGKLIRPLDAPSETGNMGTNPTLSKIFIDWAIHTLNFLTSPSIILDRKEPEIALQRARAKRGREPLPGWYEITYKRAQVAVKESIPGASGIHHSFRYDVRGHMMHVKKGRLAGRVIWIPPHQRGLANELYKPKVYRVAQDMPDQPTPWKG